MSIISYSNKPIIASLLAALPLGSSVWPTSAQVRFIGMHLGGPGGWRSFDHSSDLHDRPYASRWHDDWYSGAIASEEAAPLYAVPVYPAVPSADPYRLAYCSQRYHSSIQQPEPIMAMTGRGMSVTEFPRITTWMARRRAVARLKYSVLHAAWTLPS
jgi:hypothetical protein